MSGIGRIVNQNGITFFNFVASIPSESVNDLSPCSFTIAELRELDTLRCSFLQASVSGTAPTRFGTSWDSYSTIPIINAKGCEGRSDSDIVYV